MPHRFGVTMKSTSNNKTTTNSQRFVLWIGIVCLLGSQVTSFAAEMEAEELELEIVTEQRQKPKRNPDVFDPLSDPRWLAGFRETFPTEIPDELKSVDALTRTKAMKRLVACVDGWFYPFSHTAARSEPPGIDIELLRIIAKRQGWKIDIVWADTKINLDVAFRRTIDKGYCDIFTGLAISGEDDALDRHLLEFTKPYIGLGFVLAVRGKAENVRSLDDIKRLGYRVGVPMLSPMEDYVRKEGIPHELYFQNQRVIEGMVKGEVEAGVIWSGAVALGRKTHQMEFNAVPGYVPLPGQRWNGAWAVNRKETGLREFIDQEFDALLKDGEIRRIVESYHVPFFAPWDDAPKPSTGTFTEKDSRAIRTVR
jgi:ABC-type amino acid transport substrate-binding protein